MEDNSRITWTEASWNPLRGTLGHWHCTKVSTGCTYCDAERTNLRLGGPPYVKGADTFRLHEEALTQPRRWTKPRKISVCTMSDLFHEDVPEEWIDRIVGAMLRAPQHIYLILTKRPERMRNYLGGPAHAAGLATAGAPFPVPNFWLGITLEDQQHADERLPYLKETPAAIRWVSCEPLLGPVVLWEDRESGQRGPGIFAMSGVSPSTSASPPEGYDCSYPFVDWVVVGGESGPQARAMEIAWVRSLRDQCIRAGGQSNGVSFCFKQWGQWEPIYTDPPDAQGVHVLRTRDGQIAKAWVSKVRSCPALDGVIWQQSPTDYTFECEYTQAGGVKVIRNLIGGRDDRLRPIRPPGA